MNLPINCIRVIVPDEDIEIERDGRFGICMALFARVFEGKPENLIEGFHLMGLNKKTKIGLVEVGLTVASLFLVFSVITTGISVYENIVAKSEYERASNATESRLALAQQQRDAAKARVDSLSTIDRRYNEIFKFVYAQVDEDLNIASIDTMDMIPSTETTGSAYGSETTDSSQAVSDPSQVTQQTDGEQGLLTSWMSQGKHQQRRTRCRPLLSVDIRERQTALSSSTKLSSTPISAKSKWSVLSRYLCRPKKR